MYVLLPHERISSLTNPDARIHACVNVIPLNILPSKEKRVQSGQLLVTITVQVTISHGKTSVGSVALIAISTLGLYSTGACELYVAFLNVAYAVLYREAYPKDGETLRGSHKTEKRGLFSSRGTLTDPDSVYPRPSDNHGRGVLLWNQELTVFRTSDPADVTQCRQLPLLSYTVVPDHSSVLYRASSQSVSGYHFIICSLC
ncbi:hypothetical protein GW750_08225 [bacterium]|nr:hypothetical protein [bacterium]